jgi:4-hydroxybenzoate polyprenyltransferase
LFANICWGLGIGATILGGASVTAISTSSIVAAFTLAFLTAGCGFTKDLKDLEGDKAMNVHTLPIIFGERQSIKVMTAASVVGFPLLFWNMFCGVNLLYLTIIIVTIIAFAWSLLVLYRHPGSKTIYKKAYKLQATAGFLILLAFVVNSIM